MNQTRQTAGTLAWASVLLLDPKRPVEYEMVRNMPELVAACRLVVDAADEGGARVSSESRFIATGT